MKIITYLGFTSLIVLTFSCMGTRGMQVQVARPAEITVTPDIQTLTIVNHSIPSTERTAESILTVERKDQDKQLSEECLQGLNQLLQESSRFKVKRCENTFSSFNPSSIAFGRPLDWNFVDSLCKAYETDGLLVLEYFDTDFRLNNPGAAAGQAIGSVLNGQMPSVTVTGVGTAKAGYRFYYPKTKTIVYENTFTWSKNWQETSTNPIDAVNRMIQPSQALMDVSYQTGREFAKRIIPLYYWENRFLYKGKRGNMERAERYALAKDWEKALEIWKEEYEMSPKKKVRARAAHNAALAEEVFGNLQNAYDWAQKGYVEKDKDEALYYIETLDKRIREQNKLKEQQQNEGK